MRLPVLAVVRRMEDCASRTYNPQLRVTPVNGNEFRFCSTFLLLPVLTAVRRMEDVAVVAHDPKLRSVTSPQSMQVIGYIDRLRLLLVFRTTGQRKADNARQTNLVRQAGIAEPSNAGAREPTFSFIVGSLECDRWL